jgi:hypothetical protein
MVQNRVGILLGVRGQAPYNLPTSFRLRDQAELSSLTSMPTMTLQQNRTLLNIVAIGACRHAAQQMAAFAKLTNREFRVAILLLSQAATLMTGRVK